MNDKLNSPFNTQTEDFLIGSALIDEKTASDVLASLKEEEFFDGKNKNIFRAMEKINNRKEKIDHSSVAEELSRMGVLNEIGGEEYLINLMESAPSYIASESYIESTKEKALGRRLLDVTKEISDKAKSNEMPLKELMEFALTKINAVVAKRKATSFVDVGSVADEVLDAIEDIRKNDNNLTGIDTGFTKLNEITNGFQKGELIILAARPSLGKSTLALNIATHVCKTMDKAVAFFSLEMGNPQLVMRILSSVSAVPLNDIKKGKLTDDDMASIYFAKNQISKYKLNLYDDSFTDIQDIRLSCQKLQRDAKLDLLIIDYMQLITADGKSRYEQVSKISRMLKVLARELDIPVIALSQLSRDIEKRDKESRSPMLADLRESGSIEQDADIVMFLHKKTAPKTDDETVKRLNSRTELLILKNRQGPTGEVPLIFKGQTCSFSQYEG